LTLLLIFASVLLVAVLLSALAHRTVLSTAVVPVVGTARQGRDQRPRPSHASLDPWPIGAWGTQHRP
jgi:hypothetical protein